MVGTGPLLFGGGMGGGGGSQKTFLRMGTGLEEFLNEGKLEASQKL